MKGKGILGVFLALAATPALAGTLYRCEGAGGIPSYTSKRIQGAACKAISYRQPVAAPKPAPAPAPEAAAKAVGSAAPPNTVAGSPVSARVPATPRSPRFLRMASSTLYSYIDANGVRNYSNRRPRGVSHVSVTRVEYPVFLIDTCYACAALPAVNFGKIRLNTAAYQPEIAAAARQHGVDEAVVRAIIHAESAFNPNALSRVGAQGLMQLMPATARRFGVANAFDASQNIAGGVQYLAWLLKRFNGDVRLAAAGYNAGEGAVDKYGGVPPYAETQRYVQRVAVLAERYRGAIASSALATK